MYTRQDPRQHLTVIEASPANNICQGKGALWWNITLNINPGLKKL